jgi:hypothetical protein
MGAAARTGWAAASLSDSALAHDSAEAIDGVATASAVTSRFIDAPFRLVPDSIAIRGFRQRPFISHQLPFKQLIHSRHE